MKKKLWKVTFGPSYKGSAELVVTLPGGGKAEMSRFTGSTTQFRATDEDAERFARDTGLTVAAVEGEPVTRAMPPAEPVSDEENRSIKAKARRASGGE